MHQPIQQRQHQQRQQRRRQNPPNDYGCQRPLHFRSGAGCQRHRHESQRRHQRGHQDRPPARHGAFEDGVVERAAFFAQGADEGDHDQAVEHRHAGQRDEADGGGDR